MGFNSLPRQEPRKKNQHYILVLWCKVSKAKVRVLTLMAGRTFIINKESVLTLNSSPPVLPPHIYATLSNALGRLLPLRPPLPFLIFCLL